VLFRSSGTSAYLSFKTGNNTDSTLIQRIRIDSSADASTPAKVVLTNAGLEISSTAVTSPAATDGNVFSGTYTPTQVSTNTNVDSIAFSASQYMRVGNVVTVSGLIQINPTLAATQTVVKFSLPIASAFASAFQLGGTGSSSSVGFYGTVNAAFMADTVNDCVEIRLTPTFTGAVDFRFHFTYRIV
jgi:hypothetical protein